MIPRAQDRVYSAKQTRERLAGANRLRPIEHRDQRTAAGVNIDHVATLRQARFATMPESKNAEPDPIAIAGICERAGAHGITALEGGPAPYSGSRHRAELPQPSAQNSTA